VSDRPPGLRASDADRETVVTRLHAAAMEGRLDADELDERLTVAYGAKYCSELEGLTADVTPPPAPPAAPPVFVRDRAGTNGFAIASFVCGLVWVWWIGSLAAIAFGHTALRQIARSGGAQGGRGLAIAGLALGYIGLVTVLITFIAVVVL
jgi:hypothetical protein